MDPLDEEIAELKAAIKRYEAEYVTTSSEDKRQLLLQTINNSSQTLNRLLDEKARRAAPTAGISSSIYIYYLNLFVEYACSCPLRSGEPPVSPASGSCSSTR
jgi:hypothetical protein